MADCPKYRYVDSWTQTVLNVYSSDYRGYTPVRAEYVAWQVTVNSINFGPWASADIQVEGLDDLDDVRQSFGYTCLATDTYPKTFGSNSLGGATVQLRYYIQVPVNHVGSPISWDFEIQFIGDCAPSGGWYAWGTNNGGVLGVGDFLNRPETPTPMHLDAAVPTIYAAQFSAFGILDGQLYAWGENSDGGLGLPSTGNYSTPVAVSGMTNVTSIAAANSFSMALKSDGTIWFAGQNTQGQFGNNSVSSSPSTVWTQTTIAPPNIAKIASGNQVSAIIDDTAGQLWMAGLREVIPDGLSGFTGRYTTFFKCTLVATGLLALAVGQRACIALYSDHTVYVWGDVSEGRAGDGISHPIGTKYSSPVAVPGLSNIAAIAAGAYTFFALDTAGRLWTWGRNQFIECGIASATVADAGDEILSPTRWSNATTLSVDWIAGLNYTMTSVMVKSSDGKLYGSGTNRAPSRAAICRLAEQPAGTSTWLRIPGPTHGYPEFDTYDPLACTFVEGTASFVKWIPIELMSIPSRLATIVG